LFEIFFFHDRCLKYHFSDDVDERSELAADVEEVENADDEDGDDEAVEDASVGNKSRNEADRETSEEQRDDDRVDDVPHVRVEDAQLLAKLGRLAHNQLDTHNNRSIRIASSSVLRSMQPFYTRYTAHCRDTMKNL